MKKAPIDVPVGMLKFAVLAAIHAFGSSDVRIMCALKGVATRASVVNVVTGGGKNHCWFWRRRSPGVFLGAAAPAMAKRRGSTLTPRA